MLIMLIRWMIPRLFDQPRLAWKVLIPLSLANVVIVMTVLNWLEPLVAVCGFDWAVPVAGVMERTRSGRRFAGVRGRAGRRHLPANGFEIVSSQSCQSHIKT